MNFTEYISIMIFLALGFSTIVWILENMLNELRDIKNILKEDEK